jgi:hypothetical protein
MCFGGSGQPTGGNLRPQVLGEWDEAVVGRQRLLGSPSPPIPACAPEIDCVRRRGPADGFENAGHALTLEFPRETGEMPDRWALGAPYKRRDSGR